MYHYDYPSSSHGITQPPMMPQQRCSKLSTELIAHSISYHGLPLQKMWEGERGETDLHEQGLLRPDYSIYQMRQKYLTFQDRAKRLKLHQFISKKADAVFDKKLMTGDQPTLSSISTDGDVVVQIPPYEVFLNVDPYERTRHFFQTIQIGDIIYGSVYSSVKSSILVKIICVTGSIQRFVGDLGIKAMLPPLNTIPPFNKINDRYDVNDYVCCEILELSPESQKIILTMKGKFPRSESIATPFGLITTDNFPEVYKTASEIKNLSYTEVLEMSSTFKNPNSEDAMFLSVGLNPNEYCTNMTSLNGKFPANEYASQIRQDQASKWAFRSVAEGIEHFKEGRHSEAFSCLNKALSIDPRNVEGLVARGALYANSGSFKKAVEDFETALQINNTHANARKYLGETLVALGRSYEDENKYEDAQKAYQDCLKIVPMHEEALNSLEFLRNKGQTKLIVPPTEFSLPPLNLNKGPKIAEQALHTTRQNDKNRKEKSKKKRKRHDSSSSDSSSSSGSSNSSSSSSSSDSESDRSKQKGKKKHETSPFSQQMMKGSHQFNQPFQDLNFNANTDDYESKVRKFLDMARADDDHEDKVRKLIEDAARYQEERKGLDPKSKKKKRKEDKKAKKDAKKKRKKEKKNKKSKLDLNEVENAKIREALKIFESLPVLDDLGAKLSEIYGVKNESNILTTKVAQPNLLPIQAKASFEDSKQNKWKMSFQNKDEVRPLGIPGPSKLQTYSQTRPGKGLTPPDSDDETHMRFKDSKQTKQAQSTRIPSQLKQYGRSAVSPPAPAPPVKSGPVVLDKFGCFRLAVAEPIEQPAARDKSIDRRSRTRSRSRNRGYNYNRRRRSRSNSSENRRKRNKRSTSRDLYRRLAISRSRSRSPIRSFRGGRGKRGRFNSGYLDRMRRTRSRSRSPTKISPIRATNPLGRPFGGGRGRGRGAASGGRWIRGGYKFNNYRGRSTSDSPKRYNSNRNRDDRSSPDLTKDKSRSNRSRSRKRDRFDKQKSNEPKKIDQSKSIDDSARDPPPPGTEDDITKPH